MDDYQLMGEKRVELTELSPTHRPRTRTMPEKVKRAYHYNVHYYKNTHTHAQVSRRLLEPTQRSTSLQQPPPQKESVSTNNTSSSFLPKSLETHNVHLPLQQQTGSSSTGGSESVSSQRQKTSNTSTTTTTTTATAKTAAAAPATTRNGSSAEMVAQAVAARRSVEGEGTGKEEGEKVAREGTAILARPREQKQATKDREREQKEATKDSEREQKEVAKDREREKKEVAKDREREQKQAIKDREREQKQAAKEKEEEKQPPKEKKQKEKEDEEVEKSNVVSELRSRRRNKTVEKPVKSLGIASETEDEGATRAGGAEFDHSPQQQRPLVNTVVCVLYICLCCVCVHGSLSVCMC